MNKKLLAGLATAGILAGGGGAAALAATSGPAAASTVPAAASTQLPGYGPLGSLVAKGTITQAQATAIRNALITYMRGHWQDMRRDCTGSAAEHTPWMLEQGGALQTVLGQLVRNHTITQAQASAITSAYTQWVNSDHGTGPHGHGPWGDGGPMMGGPRNGMM